MPVGLPAASRKTADTPVMGAMVYLGGMDVLFNLEHGKYADRGPEMLLEIAINVACLGFGPFTMLRLWGRRTRLGSMFGR